MYHAYSTNADKKWYYIIAFFPIGGSLYYLYHHFYSRRNIENLSEGLKKAMDTNYEILRLEKEVKFSDTFTNRKNLADQYLELAQYEQAISIYKTCLEGYNHDNIVIKKSLLNAYYLNEDFEQVVAIGDQIKDQKDFSKSLEKASYAWALFQIGKTAQAEQHFIDFDHSFSNYQQRLLYCKFLAESKRSDQAIDKLGEIRDEFEQMQSFERRYHKDIRREINRVYSDLSSNKKTA